MRECKKHNWSFGVNSNFCPDCTIEQLQAENKELAEGVLKLSATLRYLNGMVKRGRGADISDDIEANIKWYVIELETELAKAKPVLDAAGECASFYEVHKDFYNEKDTRGFDVGEAMRLLSKCNEAVCEYKGEV